MQRREFLGAGLGAAVKAGVTLAAVTGPWSALPAHADESAEQRARAVRVAVDSSSSGPSAAGLAELSRQAAGTERLRALVVSQEGETVLAKAYRGPAVDRAVNVKSVSKALVTTLVGIAQQRGVIESVQQTLGSLVPKFIPEGADARVAALTLENLMTMQAGLDRVSGVNYGRWVSSDNWIRYALSRPFVARPGGRMLYSTGDTHVLGAVLAERGGQSLYALANTWLGEPVGVDFAPWTRDPQGYYMGGNEMSAAPAELVRVGELYLAGGVVDGERVLPEGWVEQAFTARTRSPFSGDGYGYGRFLRDFNGVQAAYARGYGGQVLYVIPEFALSIVITSDPTQRARSQGYMTVLHDMVQQYLHTA